MPGPLIIADRYALGDKLGEGGQATVYRAWDAVAGREVAVKLFGAQELSDPTAVGRMRREQRAMVALAGTNAVEFIDLCPGPANSLCLVMELLHGHDLEEHLSALERSGRWMPFNELIASMAPVVETLDKAHSVGIVHRDLKPSNVFLLSAQAGGGSRLLDFGMAHLSSADPLTQVGMVMGSPSYIAPEGWSGKPKSSDGRADVYALGVILFRMLAGRLPFQGKSLVEKMRNTTAAERPSLCALRAELPARVDIWVERALAIDPGDRFRTAGACFGELLWALDLAPHPSEQRRVRLSEATVVGMRAFLLDESNVEEPIEELTALSLEPLPPGSEDDEAGAVLDSLPLLSIEPLPLSDAPDAELANYRRAAVGALPPLPKLPSMPALAPTVRPPAARAQEPSAVRSVAHPVNGAFAPPEDHDDVEEATTFYAPAEAWMPRKR